MPKGRLAGEVLKEAYQNDVPYALSSTNASPELQWFLDQLYLPTESPSILDWEQFHKDSNSFYKRRMDQVYGMFADKAAGKLSEVSPEALDSLRKNLIKAVTSGMPIGTIQETRTDPSGKTTYRKEKPLMGHRIKQEQF